VGRRNRRRERQQDDLDAPRGREAGRRAGAKPEAPTSEYADAEGNVLVLRGSLSPASRVQYAATLGGGLEREDAWQRAAELLFERLAVSWTIAGVAIDRQKDLLGRYRMASADERRFVRDTLRAHLAEHFPDMEAP
jgi:hypothetical protein